VFEHVIILYAMCFISGYLVLNLKDCVHVAHSIHGIPYTFGYAIHHAFGLVFNSEYMLLLVAVGFLVTIPPYLIAEWLSNRKSLSRCLVFPESSHDDET